MPNDEVKSFINNVQNNNNVDAGQDFKDAIRAKVGDALEVKRKEIANNFVKNNVTKEEENVEEV